jgi:hypothetical protein
MSLSLEQRVFIIEQYFINFNTQCPTKECLNAFVREYGKKSTPSRRNIQKLVLKFRQTGNIASKNHIRKRHILTEEKINEIDNSFKRNPHTSLRRRSTELDLSYESCRKAAKELKLFPYRIRTIQELKEPDIIKRTQFCNWFLNFAHKDGILDLIFFTDEAWFHLSGHVNSQNSRIWATTNPNQYIQSQLYSQKIGVWCAMSRRRIIGPIFFTQLINSKEYIKILDKFISELNEEELNGAYFQQDGAKSHISRETSSHLIAYFKDRLISKSNRYLSTMIEWPPRSPDLSSPDFFLWGYLKDRVYASNPQNLGELKLNISNEICNISTETLIKVSDNMVYRTELCLQVNGSHFQHLL